MTKATGKGKKKTKKIKSNKHIFKSIMLIGLAFMLALGFFGIGAVKSIIEAAPPLDLKRIGDQSQTSFFYDQDGNPITEYFGFENRVWATIDEIPERLQKAFISIEDKRFDKHKGIDYIRLGGAFLNNLKGGHVQGASTITQQLVKTLYLTSERSYKRKIQEAYLSLKMEGEFSKAEILEAYLNTINFEEGNYGVKAASKDYFGKDDMKDLTLKEMAVLAGIVRNPSAFNPRRNLYGGEDRKEITENRAELVLKAMLENGYITEAEFDNAKKEKLHVVEEASRLKLYEMAPFIEYSIYEVRDAIIKLKGWNNDKAGREKADEFIYSNGLKIYTTLDQDIQKSVEDTLYNWEGYPVLKDDDNPLPQPQAAAVVMDNAGYIKAIVGGSTPPSGKRELNRATSPVMIGSTIKPIAIYGPALEEGKSPASIYHNIPVKIEGWDLKQDYPDNYGGGSFTGPTTMRYGLRQSLNVVAAQVLAQDLGFDKSRIYLEGLGIEPSHIEVNGSGLALGTSTISPVELAGAYSAIAGGGVYHEPISVIKVVDRDGKIIIDRRENRVSRKVFEESTSWMLIDMMKDAARNGTGKKALIPEMTVAGKTGTNSDFKGVSFAGFTPYYTAAVWIGHDEGKSLGDNITGGDYAAPLWQAFMAKIHQEKNLEDKDILDMDPKSLGLVKESICKVSGKLPGPDCPPEDIVTDWFLPKFLPKDVCREHETIKICTISGKFPGPYCPEETIGEKRVYFLEANSPYWQFSKNQIRKWIPEAYFDFNSLWEINNLQYNDPNQSQYFCDFHLEPENPGIGDFFDDGLDRLRDFFQGLRPGRKKENDERLNNGNNDNSDNRDDIEGEGWSGEGWEEEGWGEENQE